MPNATSHASYRLSHVLQPSPCLRSSGQKQASNQAASKLGSSSKSKQSSTRHLRFLLHMLRLVSWVVVPWVVTVVTVVTWLSLSFACRRSVTRPSLAYHSPLLTHTRPYSPTLTHTLSPTPVHPRSSTLLLPFPFRLFLVVPPPLPSISLLPPWAARLPYHHLGQSRQSQSFALIRSASPFALTPSLPRSLTPSHTSPPSEYNTPGTNTPRQTPRQ